MVRKAMKLTPEMIDAAVIQLRGLFDVSEDIPEKVKSTGTNFLDSLDEWSESMKSTAKTVGQSIGKII